MYEILPRHLQSQQYFLTQYFTEIIQQRLPQAPEHQHAPLNQLPGVERGYLQQPYGSKKNLSASACR